MRDWMIYSALAVMAVGAVSSVLCALIGRSPIIPLVAAMLAGIAFVVMVLIEVVPTLGRMDSPIIRGEDVRDFLAQMDSAVMTPERLQ